MYGCGSTEHGQLPYLRYSQDGSSDGQEAASMSAAELEDIPARNEITIPTRLRLPVRQARHLSRRCCLQMRVSRMSFCALDAPLPLGSLLWPASGVGRMDWL